MFLSVSSGAVAEQRQQSSSDETRHGFVTSREQRKPVWSLLNVFSAVQHCLSRMTKLGVKKHTKHRWNYHSWDNPNCFLSASLFPILSPVCQYLTPCRDYNRVHGGTPLCIVKSQLALGTSFLPQCSIPKHLRER